PGEVNAVLHRSRARSTERKCSRRIGCVTGKTRCARARPCRTGGKDHTEGFALSRSKSEGEGQTSDGELAVIDGDRVHCNARSTRREGSGLRAVAANRDVPKTQAGWIHCKLAWRRASAGHADAQIRIGRVRNHADGSAGGAARLRSKG